MYVQICTVAKPRSPFLKNEMCAAIALSATASQYTQQQYGYCKVHPNLRACTRSAACLCGTSVCNSGYSPIVHFTGLRSSLRYTPEYKKCTCFLHHFHSSPMCRSVYITSSASLPHCRAECIDQSETAGDDTHRVRRGTHRSHIPTSPPQMNKNFKTLLLRSLIIGICHSIVFPVTSYLTRVAVKPSMQYHSWERTGYIILDLGEGVK